MATKHVLVYLGNPDQAEARKNKLHEIAVQLDLTTPRGTNGQLIGNISALVQQIADGELVVLKAEEAPQLLGD